MLVSTRKGKGKFFEGDCTEALHFFREARLIGHPALKLLLILFACASMLSGSTD